MFPVCLYYEHLFGKLQPLNFSVTPDFQKRLKASEDMSLFFKGNLMIKYKVA